MKIKMQNKHVKKHGGLELLKCWKQKYRIQNTVLFLRGA
jgi:hypothetical protein